MIAQLGERQTEDLKVPGSIPGRGSFFCFFYFFLNYRILTMSLEATEKVQISLKILVKCCNFSREKYFLRLHSAQPWNVFAYSRQVFARINYYLSSLDLAKLNIAKVKNPLKS